MKWESLQDFREAQSLPIYALQWFLQSLIYVDTMENPAVCPTMQDLLLQGDIARFPQTGPSWGFVQVFPWSPLKSWCWRETTPGPSHRVQRPDSGHLPLGVLREEVQVAESELCESSAAFRDEK